MALGSAQVSPGTAAVMQPIQISSLTVRQPFQNHSQCADAMCKVINNMKVVADKACNNKVLRMPACRVVHHGMAVITGDGDKWCMCCRAKVAGYNEL